MSTAQILDFQSNDQLVCDFTSSTCQFEILKKTSGIFEDLWDTDLEHLLQNKHWDNVQTSHLKKNLFTKLIDNRTFSIDLIKFTGIQHTGLHTHPEVLVDGIISGSLREKSYVFTGQGYQLINEEVRSAGSVQRQFDPNGSPHSVIAHDGPCFSLCISYGATMKYIDEKLILEKPALFIGDE